MRPERAQFADEVRALTPDAVDVIDVHTHLGRDEDSHELAPDGLLAMLDEIGARRACVFALHDPDRHPAYRRPNDRVLDEAAGSVGRLIPFCRLDPADGALAELQRCLRRGARGVKLHPRAQRDGFPSMIGDILRAAHDARIPVLIHAGRGLPPIADALIDAAYAAPDAPLILAHAGMADLATFAHRLADHPRAVFDTSAFSPLDLMELFARVPAARIVFGSDPPYGQPFAGMYLTLRCAAAAGLDEADVRNVLGGTAEGLLAGQELSVAPARPAATRPIPLSLLRLSGYCAAALADLNAGRTTSASDNLALALGVCRDPAAGVAARTLSRARVALEAVGDALARGERPRRDLLYLTMVMAATEPAPS